MEAAAAIEDDLITLPDPRIDPGRTNIVRARRIVVAGTLTLNGQSLAMYARDIVFQPNSLIDTSGGPPDRDYSATPTNNLPPDPNATSGKQGLSGSSGKNGGAIRIWAENITGPLAVRSAGGPGGRGQDGGVGPRGATGAPAPQGLHIGTSNMGHPGEIGLIGGAAGVSGNGGNGGDVDIAYVESVTTSTLAYNQGGNGGAAALGGPGGPGGFGGAGGPFGHLENPRPGPPGITIGIPKQDGVSPVAATGPTGPNAPNGQVGQPGLSGKSQIRQFSLADFSATATSSHLAMLVSTGEALYRNSQFTAAAEILGYVYQIAQQKGEVGGAH